MKETGGEINISIEDFEDIISRFKAKPTKTYDFLVKAGKESQNVIFQLCKRIIEDEDIPKSFYLTILHMLWKMKGAANILANNRFLHIKSWLPKACEALVVDKMKCKILEHSTKYEIGGQPGYSHNEYVFAIISIILKEEKEGKGIIFTAADIIKFFDKEDIFDVIGELYNIEMNQKLCRLW